jgi:predicted GNAT family N-acyltransferase
VWVEQQLTFKVADPEERDVLLGQRRTIFSSDLGYVPDDGLDDVACHLIACTSDSEVIAAFRLLEAHHRPFDFEEVLSLDGVVEAGRRPAMIGRLWVRPDRRGIRTSMAVHQGLLRLAIQVAKDRSISDYYLSTFTRLITFYRAASFRDTGTVHIHSGWGPLHVMHRDLFAPHLTGRRRNRLTDTSKVER